MRKVSSNPSSPDSVHVFRSPVFRSGFVLFATCCFAAEADASEATPGHGSDEREMVAPGSDGASGHVASGHGALGHGAAHHGPSILWPTLNFIIYVSLFIVCVKKFINPALKARAIEVEQQLQKSSREIALAAAELSERETRLAGISQEQRLIRERLEQDGERIANEILKNAEAGAADIKADVEKKAGRELAKASSEVRQLVIAGAALRARELLRETLSREDDRRLRQEAINSLFE